MKDIIILMFAEFKANTMMLIAFLLLLSTIFFAYLWIRSVDIKSMNDVKYYNDLRLKDSVILQANTYTSKLDAIIEVNKKLKGD